MHPINQRGFSHLVLLVALIVFSATIVTGINVFRNSTKNSSKLNKQQSVSSFEQCIAAGNPVGGTTPKRCLANGTVYLSEGSTPNLKPAVIKPPTEDEIKKWKTYTANNGSYSISVPDGWGDLVTCSKRSAGFSISAPGSLNYIPGRPATIEGAREHCPLTGEWGFNIYQSSKNCTHYDEKRRNTIRIPNGYAHVMDIPSDFTNPEEIGIIEYTLLGENGVQVCMVYLQPKEYPDIRPLLLPIAQSYRAY